jgi:hypothetical protein
MSCPADGLTVDMGEIRRKKAEKVEEAKIISD